MQLHEIAAQAAANDWSAAEITALAVMRGIPPLEALAAVHEAVRAQRPAKHMPLADEIALDLDIEYEGAGGKASTRRVTLHRLLGVRRPDGTRRLLSLACYCHTAKAPRTFLVSGVRRLSDPATGEVAPDAVAWLLQRTA